ncbi:Uncharacterized protein ALO50_00024 [Pseudomonas syringae pv. cerasicola]|uniref:Uncharacterized protein n=9 Tax=Pseudomonas syringae group TaxID=136849 RepID=A0A0P9N121_PSESX|nr:Uncharacterized protein ALO50_00024 [Pseudomonas syringae pv. cerasicola]
MLAQGLQGFEDLLGEGFDLGAIDVGGGGDITRLDNARLVPHTITQLSVVALQLLGQRDIQRFSGVLAEQNGQLIKLGKSGLVLVFPARSLLRIADGDHAQDIDVHTGQCTVDIVHGLGGQKIPVVQSVDILSGCLECMDHEKRQSDKRNDDGEGRGHQSLFYSETAMRRLSSGHESSSLGFVRLLNRDLANASLAINYRRLELKL